jgi:DNA-binding response OmpR family regulator
MTLILVVEDELSIARIVRDYLVHAGFEVEMAGDGEAALVAARTLKPGLASAETRRP